MDTLMCRTCGQEKPLGEFYPRTRVYRNKGLVVQHQAICKPCKRAYVAGRYRHRRSVIPEGMKHCGYCRRILPFDQFGVNRGRKDGRQTYCLECWPQRLRKYRPPLKSRVPKKLRHDAKWYVHLAVRFGHVVPKPCEVCGAKQVQAHHTDYMRPLHVTWLCQVHHRAIHGGKAVGPFFSTAHSLMEGEKP